MAKFFKYIWAQDGDFAVIPDTTQSDGSVSYDQGWGPDYQRPTDGSDPLSKDIDRTHFNKALQDLTGAAQQYQTHGFPDFITPTINGGTAYSYDIYAVVRYDDGTGVKLYQSTSNANIALPTDNTKWVLFGQSGDPVGTGKDFFLSTLPSGYVWGNGNTIGDAGSNATNRANADTFNLFVAYWNENQYKYTGTTANPAVGQLQVYDSSGLAVARGTNAAADWAAKRQIAVIDKRGRASFGQDNMGAATAAGRLTGTSGGLNGSLLGAVGGLETNTLDITQAPSHFHHSGIPHIDNGSFGSDDVGGTAVRVSGFGSAPSSTLSTRTDTKGGNQPHNNVPPGIVCNYILKL